MLRNSILSFIGNNLKFRSAFLSTSSYKEETIKLGKWNINYLKVGNGPHHILCMPGALGTIWTDFGPQVEGLNRDQFTVVAWDPPGYGKSRPPERDFSDDIYQKNAHFASEFMKALKIPKYSLLGWSSGGVSSIIMSAKWPDAVDKMVVWGINVICMPHLIEKFQSLKDINLWSPTTKDAMVQIYGEELLQKYYAQWVDGLANLVKTRNGNICSEMLTDVRCPTFIMYGEKDPLIDIGQVYYTHKNIKGSRIHTYPEGKHSIHLTYSEDFNKRVEDFLLDTTL